MIAVKCSEQQRSFAELQQETYPSHREGQGHINNMYILEKIWWKLCESNNLERTAIRENVSDFYLDYLLRDLVTVLLIQLEVLCISL